MEIYQENNYSTEKKKIEFVFMIFFKGGKTKKIKLKCHSNVSQMSHSIQTRKNNIQIVENFVKITALSSYM